jgi:hypothetical protein
MINTHTWVYETQDGCWPTRCSRCTLSHRVWKREGGDSNVMMQCDEVHAMAAETVAAEAS